MKKLTTNSGFLMIRSAVMAPLVRALDAAGADTDGLLEEFGLSRRLLSNPYEMLTLSRYMDAFERAATVLDEPGLGLRLGGEMQIAELGPAGVVFMSSSTLRVAILKFSEALPSWQGATAIDLHSDDAWPSWSYRITNASIWPRAQDAEYSISTMCNLIRVVLGGSWTPVEVQFEHAAKAEARAYTRYFRAPVRFRQPTNALVLRARDLNAMLKTANRQMVSMMERHATDLIARDAIPDNLVDQVRDLVTRRLAHEKLKIADVAKDLGLSDRSLQRHLAAVGTSVRQIVREERQRSVTALDKHDGLSHAAIARAVGYADATVLWRAKRNWKVRA